MDAIALDDYMDSRRIGFAHVVSIDTEGHDALVVRGMARALAAARVGVVEFEFGPNWLLRDHGSQRLSDLLTWLDQLGYGCFVETKSGCLVPPRSPDGSALRSTPNGKMVLTLNVRPMRGRTQCLDPRLVPDEAPPPV